MTAAINFTRNGFPVALLLSLFKPNIIFAKTPIKQSSFETNVTLKYLFLFKNFIVKIFCP